MKYHTIYADPPWMERGGGKIKRGADRHYPLMSTKDIMALDVPSIAADDCHLYLWVMITWLKDRAGLGQYFRGITESCLFGIKGQPSYKIGADGKRCQGLTGFTAPRTIHSRKPEEMRRMIESVSYGPFVELFAREPHTGWDVWGNEVEGIALGSLPKISL